MPERWVLTALFDVALRMGVCARCGTKYVDAADARFTCDECYAWVHVPADVAPPP